MRRQLTDANRRVQELTAENRRLKSNPGGGRRVVPPVTGSAYNLILHNRFNQKLKINGTQLIIGELSSLSYPSDCINTDGSLDLASAGTVALSGLDSYHQAQPLGRMAYAKPDLPPRRLNPS